MQTATASAAQTARDKAARLVASQSTPALVTSLRLLDAQIAAAGGSVSARDEMAAMCMTRSWVIVELEERHPDAAEAVALAFEAAEADPNLPDVNYADALIAALPGR